MRRMLLLAGIVLLTLLSTASSSSAYPIAYCGSICPVLPYWGICRSECTEGNTTCGEWWVNCANPAAASNVGDQSAGMEVLDPVAEETTESGLGSSSTCR